MIASQLARTAVRHSAARMQPRRRLATEAASSGGFMQRLQGFMVGFGTAGLVGTYFFLEEFKASGAAVEDCIKKAGAVVQKNQDEITLELDALKEQVKELRANAGLK